MFFVREGIWHVRFLHKRYDSICCSIMLNTTAVIVNGRYLFRIFYLDRKIETIIKHKKSYIKNQGCKIKYSNN